MGINSRQINYGMCGVLCDKIVEKQIFVGLRVDWRELNIHTEPPQNLFQDS